ncbi:DUF2975 domain-containing protein [Kitasatospora sp. NPDC048365]|uniref:DUF2975 domain-containing protein n=1 Tax=Kitasatospora sp. NPDC048365 TaxID=3364050 RepID=UPI00372372F4
MGRLAVGALRTVLAVVFTGTVLVQVLMAWVLISGSDPEDGSIPLTAFRVITIVGLLTAEVALVCVWQLVGMVRRGTVFSHAAFRYVDGVIGSIVAAALVWFAVTAVNAPGQREDPGVTVIMAGIGVAILGVALIVLVLRMLLAQAVARDVEATRMQAELDEVI